MKRITIGLVLLAIAAGTVHAQTPEERQAEKKREENNGLLRKYNEQQKVNAEIDKQYQKTLEQTRGADAAPVKVDPWANMRGTDAAKPKQ